MQLTTRRQESDMDGCPQKRLLRESEKGGLKFLDADDFHSDANKDKMHRGTALTDDDRRDWLRNLHEALRQVLDAGISCVLACSALKRVYREQLRDGLAGVRAWVSSI